jgi:hypothetical protein
MKHADAYLFDVTTAAMTVVLGFVFDKFATGIASFAGNQSLPWVEAGVGLAAELAILLVLVSVLATLSYAHREIFAPYHRGYFLYDLLTGSLPLYVAVACVHRAVFEPGSNGDGAPSTMTVALSSLGSTFLFLIGRALWLRGSLQGPVREKASPFILGVMGFHALGIVLSVVAMMFLRAEGTVATVPVLVCACLAAAGASLYLALFWVLKVRLSVEPRDIKPQPPP